MDHFDCRIAIAYDLLQSIVIQDMNMATSILYKFGSLEFSRGSRNRHPLCAQNLIQDPCVVSMVEDSVRCCAGRSQRVSR
jgi:hypothetical protein